MKKVLLTLLSLMLIFLMTGCGDSKLGEKQIEAEILNRYSLIGESVKELKIDKRDTDEKEGNDRIWCTLYTEDEMREIERKFYIYAHHYTEGGWQIEIVQEDGARKVMPIKGVSNDKLKETLSVLGLEVNSKDIEIINQKTDLENGNDSLEIKVETADFIVTGTPVFIWTDDTWNYNWGTDAKWNSKPKHGADLTDIQKALDGQIVMCGEEEWVIDSQASINVASQNTDLENGTDTVNAKVMISDEVMSASGNTNVSLRWNGLIWEPTQIKNDSFIAEYKESYKPEFSETDIIEALDDKVIWWDTDTAQQNIIIYKENIENFKLLEAVYSEKGKLYKQHCSFVMNKGVAIFDVDAYVYFEFNNNSWTFHGNSITPTVKSVDVTGKWIGTYGDKGNMNVTLTINTQSKDGSLTATFDFSPKPTNTDGKSGSFKMRGGIDLSTLEIMLDPTEWIQHPDDYVFVKLELQLFIDEGKIAGITIPDSWWALTSDITVYK